MMKIKNRAVTALLGLTVALLLAAAMFVPSFADGAVAKIGDTEYPTLDAAIEAVPEGATEATVITLLGDAQITGNTVADKAHYYLIKNKKIKIEGEGRTVTVKNVSKETYTADGSNSGSSWINVENTELTLENVTFQSETPDSTLNGGNRAPYGMLRLNNNVKLTLNSGATLKGIARNGGALFIEGDNITVTMNDGAVITDSISNNYAPVTMFSGGNMQFIMNGGVIENGTGNSKDGGAVSVMAGTFTMNGGEIKGALGTNKELGAVYVSGTNGDAKFIMNGGSITENKCSGIYAVKNAEKYAVSLELGTDGTITGNLANRTDIGTGNNSFSVYAGDGVTVTGEPANSIKATDLISGATVWTDDKYTVASFGNDAFIALYTDLTAATRNGDGNTFAKANKLCLIKDTAINEKNTIEGDYFRNNLRLTIDGKGHKLSLTNQRMYVRFPMTLENITVEKTASGTLGNGSVFEMQGSSVVASSLTLNNVSIVTKESMKKDIAIKLSSEYCTLNFNSGKIEGFGTAVDSRSGLTIVNIGSDSETDAAIINDNTTGISFVNGTANIKKGAKISGNGSYGISASSGELNLTGAEISGNGLEAAGAGIYANGAAVTITGGTVKGNNHGLRVSGGTVNVSGTTVTGNNIGLNITDGTLDLSDVKVSENNIGLNIDGIDGKVYIGGSTSITNNINKKDGNRNRNIFYVTKGKVTFKKDFTGTAGVHGFPGSALNETAPGTFSTQGVLLGYAESGATLANAGQVFSDNDSSLFAFVNDNNMLEWTKAPSLNIKTDKGKYVKGEATYGVIRALTTSTNDAETPLEYYGTAFVISEGDQITTANKCDLTGNATFGKDKGFIVDMVEEGSSVTLIDSRPYTYIPVSYYKIKGIDAVQYVYGAPVTFNKATEKTVEYTD